MPRYDLNIAIFDTIRYIVPLLDDPPPTLRLTAVQQQQGSSCTAHSVRAHFDCLVGSLKTLFCLCLLLMQYAAPVRLTLELWHVVGKTAGTAFRA